LQEIFIQIWKEQGRYSPKAGKALGWMVPLRAPRHRPVAPASGLFSRTGALSKAGDPAAPTPREADDVFVLNDLRHFLKQCMRVLPRLQREALELAFFKGLQSQGNLPPPRMLRWER